MKAARRLCSALWALGAVVVAVPAQADPVADFYAHKTITLIVGFPPGGGYDTYVRVFARHFGQYLVANALPFIMPFVVALWLHRTLREAIFPWRAEAQVSVSSRPREKKKKRR